MLAGQRNIEHRCDVMELRRIIPTDITASAVAHVSLLTLVLLFSDVHPFGAVTAEQIPVEIVTPQELDLRESEVARIGIVERSYAAQECIFMRGDRFDYWAGVVTGLARVGNRTSL